MVADFGAGEKLGGEWGMWREVWVGGGGCEEGLGVEGWMKEFHSPNHRLFQVCFLSLFDATVSDLVIILSFGLSCKYTNKFLYLHKFASTQPSCPVKIPLLLP